MEDQTLSVATIANTIQKLKSKVDYNVEELIEFLNQDITHEVADEYVKIMAEVNNSISKQKINKRDKEMANQVFNAILMKSCESDCKGLIIDKLSQHNSILKKKMEQTMSSWQADRDELNDKLKKLNEEQKPERVEIESLDLSLIMKPGKTLTNKECTRILKQSSEYVDELDDKFRPLKIDNTKISRAYARISEDGVGKIKQKPTSSKKY